MLLLGGAMTAARRVRAQQKAMPVIGFLANGSPVSLTGFIAAFSQGLRETGYVEDQNVAIEYRLTEGRYDQLPALIADLIDRKVDLIAAIGTPTARSAKSTTSAIPIVFNVGDDPVESSLVASLARPGGNLTGVTTLNIELHPKRLELLSELVPQARVIALLVNPMGPQTERMGDKRRKLRAQRAAAPDPERQHRKRDRRRFRDSHPTACRRARLRLRSVLHQSPRAACGAGGTPWRSGDLSVARVHRFRWADQLWA
jgi:ABC-type uncharacterized transport system substrate-binding protein